MALWLDADDASTFTYSSGAVVSQWRDKSSRLNHVGQGTVAAQPSRTGSQNGRATVVCTGAVKLEKGSLAASIGGNFGLTVMAMFKKTGAQNGNESFPITITASNQPRPFDAYNQTCMTPGQFGWGPLASDVRLATTWQQWAFDLTSPAATQAGGGQLVGRLFVNGAKSGADYVQTTWTWSSTSQVLTVASRNDNATQFTGEIAEIVVYDRKLSDAERQQVEAYLYAKWIPAQVVGVQGIGGQQGPYVQEILADAPILYYRLRSSDGTTAVDSSGLGLNGAIAGAPVWSGGSPIAASPSETTVVFDGVDDKVVVPGSFSFPAKSPVTLEWWSFVSTAMVSDSVAVALGSDGSTGLRCLAHAPFVDKILYWDYGTSYGRVSCDFTPYLDTWAHICLTYDPASSTHEITINGVVKATGVMADAPNVTMSGGTIGSNGGTGGGLRWHKGYIDEFAVYKSCLPLVRRQHHYQTAIAPVTATGDRMHLNSTPGVIYGAGGDYNLGARFTPTAPGTITHFRYYSGQVGPQHTCRIWENGTQTTLASRVHNPSTVGWQEVALITPLKVSAGVPLTVTRSTDAGNYPGGPMPLSRSPYLSNPHAWYAPNNGTYPTIDGASEDYHVDVLFQVQQFGAVTTSIRPATQFRSPVGLVSAGQFGSVTPVAPVPSFPQTVPVPGLSPAVQVPHLANTALAGQKTVGFSLGQPFGQVAVSNSIRVPGVESAAAFAKPGMAYKQIVPVRGVSPGYVPHICGMYLCGQARVGYDTSVGYQRFGVPLVRIFGILPSPPIEVILYPTTEAALVLTPTAEVGEDELGDWIIRPTTEASV